MKVGIDAHVLGTRAGGNETYMRDLLRALYSHRGDTEVVPFVHPDYAGDAAGFAPWPLPVRSSYLRVPWFLSRAARQSGVDVLHVQYTAPPVSPCPYIVSMHDIVALRFPDSMPVMDRYRLRLLSGRTLRNAARVFVLTAAMRDEIAGAYGVPLERFDLVQPYVAAQFRPVSESACEAVRKKYGIRGPYVLHVGLLHPRKNLEGLARAFASLSREGCAHTLVVVGPKGWMYGGLVRRINALGLGERLHFTGYVERADLPALYAAADVFAYVSAYEGFGIPVLEALACGTPVLASTDPALCEVTGGGAVHVPHQDDQAIAQGLRQLLEDPRLRAELREAGIKRAAEFTPGAMARAALAGYRKALA